MSIFPQSGEDPPQPNTQNAENRQPGSSRAAVGWAVALVLTAVAVVVAVWQVNEQLYTPQTTAEQYWGALASADGAEALGQFAQTPEPLQDDQLDHVLLDGTALARSAELIEAPRITGGESDTQLEFIVGAESYTTEVPVTHTGTTWGFFDTWGVSAGGLTWFEIEVPGAPQGGIGQVQINGQAVNLDEETAQLSAFVPSAAEITVESQWLTGGAALVVTADQEPQDQDGGQQVTLDLEASDAAVELLHAEVAEFFDRCDQTVLMPAGCPVGTTTPHRVDAETIEWNYPEVEEFHLTFDAEGWQISHDELVAEVSFEATHHHSGEQLTETEEVPFDLDVQVGASGEDLNVSVSGR